MRNCATEFPNFPAMAIPAMGDGWSDQSWHNEPCPSFLHDESGVVLYCDHPDASQREWAEFSPPQLQFVQMATRCPVNGWQHGDDDRAVLNCANLIEAQDLLDSLAIGDSMPDALRMARLRLNQTTLEDARAIIAENDKAGKPCPDLRAGMLDIIGDQLAEKWARKIGLGFHPDTRGADYVPALSAADAAEYDRNIAELFALPGCPYARGLAAFERLGLIEGARPALCPPDLEWQGGSWIVSDLATGEAVLETYSRAVADAINRKRYAVHTAAQWLASLNMPKPA